LRFLFISSTSKLLRLDLDPLFGRKSALPSPIRVSAGILRREALETSNESPAPTVDRLSKGDLSIVSGERCPAIRPPAGGLLTPRYRRANWPSRVDKSRRGPAPSWIGSVAAGVCSGKGLRDALWCATPIPRLQPTPDIKIHGRSVSHLIRPRSFFLHSFLTKVKLRVASLRFETNIFLETTNNYFR